MNPTSGAGFRRALRERPRFRIPRQEPMFLLTLFLDETHLPLSAQKNSLGQRAPGSLCRIYGRPTTIFPERAPIGLVPSSWPCALQLALCPPVAFGIPEPPLLQEKPCRNFPNLYPCAIGSPRVAKDRTARHLHYFNSTI